MIFLKSINGSNYIEVYTQIKGHDFKLYLFFFFTFTNFRCICGNNKDGKTQKEHLEVLVK